MSRHFWYTWASLSEPHTSESMVRASCLQKLHVKTDQWYVFALIYISWVWFLLDDLCNDFHTVLMLSQWVITERYDMKMASSFILSKCVSMHYPSTEWSKYSNCTINPFHHHCQGCLIHHFDQGQTSLSTHVIQFRSQVRPGYFIKWHFDLDETWRR